jgi:hypothetical protein
MKSNIRVKFVRSAHGEKKHAMKLGSDLESCMIASSHSHLHIKAERSHENLMQLQLITGCSALAGESWDRSP